LGEKDSGIGGKNQRREVTLAWEKKTMGSEGKELVRDWRGTGSRHGRTRRDRERAGIGGKQEVGLAG